MTIRTRLTGEEFDSMCAGGAFENFPPGKIELINGRIEIMSPPGPVHDDYADYLNEWSTSSRTAEQFRIRVRNGFLAGDDQRPEPDILWCDPGRYLDRKPLPREVHLLIEISDSSINRDLGRKADVYAEAEVGKYWVVDIGRRCIHVLTDPVDGQYRDRRIFEPPQTLHPRCHPTAKLDLTDLFIDAAT